MPQVFWGMLSGATPVREEDRPARKLDCKAVTAAPSAHPTVALEKDQYFGIVLNQDKWPSIVPHCWPVTGYRFLLG